MHGLHATPHQSRAFARCELLALLMAVALLLVVTWPALAGLGSRSERVVCLTNLKRIGQAFLLWGEDHGNQRPFRTHQSQGGTWGDIRVGNVWYEFAWISNELATPRILACPSDEETTRVARDFSNQADGGFLHFNYRNNAVSYYLGTDAFPEQPARALSGDRNIAVDGRNVACSALLINVASVSFLSTTAGWTNGIHHFSGNLLFNDGSVQETTVREFRVRVPAANDNGTDHLLLPR